MSGPEFTVVVPAYQAEATLPAALASVAAQTARDYEVVVVDDGSTDRTGEIADAWCAQAPGRRVIHQANGGLPAARNAAIAAARGRWIALLDSDDWLLPQHLTRMRELLLSRPGVGLAWGDAWVWQEETGRFMRGTAMKPYRPALVPEEPEPLFRALLNQNFVFVAVAMPRTVVEALGGFDPSLRAAEDWNLWLRLVAAGHRVASTTEPVAVYRRRKGQMTDDPLRMASGGRDALRSVQRLADLSPPLQAALTEAIAGLEQEVAAAERGPGPLRALAARAKGPLRPLLETRLRPPPGVVETFPELAVGGLRRPR